MSTAWMNPQQLQSWSTTRPSQPSSWQGHWPPRAPPGPPPAPQGVDPRRWMGGQWHFNPMFQSVAPTAQPTAWAPHPSWGQISYPAGFNPWNKAPKPTTSDYWQTKLVDNPLGLEGMEVWYVQLRYSQCTRYRIHLTLRPSLHWPSSHLVLKNLRLVHLAPKKKRQRHHGFGHRKNSVSPLNATRGIETLVFSAAVRIERVPRCRAQSSPPRVKQPMGIHLELLTTFIQVRALHQLLRMRGETLLRDPDNPNPLHLQ